MFRTIFALLIFMGWLVPAAALLVDNNGTITYPINPPTDADIPGWTQGWGTTGITGWNYVGEINGTSAVYLGDNWVITAAHAGSGPFKLSGVTYLPVEKSEKRITGSDDTVDLILFKIATAPPLPPLVISRNGPNVDDPVVMIAYGGGHGETWAKNTVSRTDRRVATSGGQFKSFDFSTDFGGDNRAKFIAGDSGGGACTYNSSTAQWELAGISEAIDQNNNSYMVQLSTYANQIDNLRPGYHSPIMRWILFAFACVPLLFGLGLLINRLRRRRRRSRRY